MKIIEKKMLPKGIGISYKLYPDFRDTKIWKIISS